MRPARSLVAVVLLFVVPRLVPADEPPPIALLGALQLETEPMAATLTDRQAVSVLGIPCLSGRLAGRPVVVAAVGVGKVNAAMTTALLIERFSPAAVIFSGIAGAIDPQLQPGDVVIGDRLVQHDLLNHSETGAVLRSVRNPLTGTANPIALESSPRLLAFARLEAGRVALEPIPTDGGEPRPPRVLVGTIATGDSFVGSRPKKAELRAQVGAAAVEMEGAAVAQVCFQHGVPFLVVRGLSDRAGNEARSEAQRYLGIAAGNAARIALAVARQLGVQQPEAER
jgi:adenosylhomocysteine nucleosidase